MLPDRLRIRLHALDHWLTGEPELRMLRHVVLRGRSALDIGANIGTYSYMLRRYATAVHAYEPNPELARRLKRSLPDVHVRNAAMSDAPGRLELKIPFVGDRLEHELASVAQHFPGAREIMTFDVEATTIDAEGHDDVGFIKIDVEQHELAVLRGGVETIRRCRPVIMTETTPLLYEDDLVKTFRFLTDLGYEGWFTYLGTRYPFSEFDADVHTNRDGWAEQMFANPNVFFVPREVKGIRAYLARNE